MLDCDKVFRDCNCISPCSPSIPEPEPSLAHKAAEDVFRKPISQSVESLRRQQRKVAHTKRASRVRLPSGKVSRPRATPASAGRASRSHPTSLAASLAQEQELERLRNIVASDALRPLAPSLRQLSTRSIQMTPPVWYIAMDHSVQGGPSSSKPRSVSARRQPEVTEPSRPNKARNAYTRPVAGSSVSPSRPKPPRTRVRRPTTVGSPSKHREFPLLAMGDPGYTFRHRELVASHEKRFGVADPQL